MTTPDPAAPAATPATDPATPPEGNADPRPKTLEELLADVPEDHRAVILGEVSKARSEAKGLRDRLKLAEPKAAEHDKALEAQKTAEQRADDARKAAEERAATATQRVAKAEIKAALSGVVDNPDLIIDDLNLGKFVDQDGEVDAAAIDALRTKYAALGGGTRRAPRPDPSQASGANGRTSTDPAQEFGSLLQQALRT